MKRRRVALLTDQQYRALQHMARINDTSLSAIVRTIVQAELLHDPAARAQLQRYRDAQTGEVQRT